MNSNDGESLVKSSGGIDWLRRQIEEVSPYPIVEKNPLTSAIASIGLLLGVAAYWTIGTPIADIVDKLAVVASLLTNIDSN